MIEELTKEIVISEKEESQEEKISKEVILFATDSKEPAFNKDDMFASPIKGINKSLNTEDFVSKKQEQTIGTPQAFLVSEIVMSTATGTEASKGFNYDYHSIGNLYKCIEDSVKNVNENKLSKIGKECTVSNNVSVDILTERSCVATVRHTCTVFCKENIEIVSKYTAQTQILMHNMIMPETKGKQEADLIKQKGSWITYIKRYALLQTMQVSHFDEAEDVEKMDDRIKKQKTFPPKTENKRSVTMSSSEESELDKIANLDFAN